MKEPRMKMKTQISFLITALTCIFITSYKAYGAEENSIEGGGGEKRLLSEWSVLQSPISKNGMTFNAAYKGDYFSILTGPEEKKSGFLGNLDLTLSLDLEKQFGFNGLEMFFYGLGNHGDRPSKKFGDSFVSSNIEAPETFKLYEAYIKKTFDERFEILFGLRDLNADFYSLESSAYLINSSFGVSPSLSQTGVNGPSIFPVTAPALTTKFKSKDWFYFQAGIFNATAGNPSNPNGTRIPLSMDNGNLTILEMGAITDSTVKKISLGVWQYSKQFDAIDTSERATSENFGNYSMADIRISKQVSFFSKLGFATPKINRFARSLESGFVFERLFQNRPDDILFLGYTTASVSDDYIKINSSKDKESVFEIGYKIKVIDGFFLTPNYQKVWNPGLASQPSEGSIFLLRTNLLL